jgi:hypothetical protein
MTGNMVLMQPINLETKNCRLTVIKLQAECPLLVITFEICLYESNNNPQKNMHASLIGASRLKSIPASLPSVRQP